MSHHKIIDALAALAIPIESLNLDPANARLHGPQNIATIKASLDNFGQRKPIVVRASTMTVEAGNGTIDAARALGWSHIAAVLVDDDAITATRYALVDNRSAELATWDESTLSATLAALAEEGVDLSALGWSDHDLRDIFDVSSDDDASSSDDDEFCIAYKLIVVCRDESEQGALLARLESEGYTCQLLML